MKRDRKDREGQWDTYGSGHTKKEIILEAEGGDE